jgi:murein DD-endopeptidase MepM/ murein hydrolase activator NlpD
MRNFRPVSLKKVSSRKLSLLLWVGIPLFLVLAGLLYIYVSNGRPSGRWALYTAIRTDRATFERYAIQPGQRCGNAPFAFPTSGVILGLWDQSYRWGHRHAGVDIFSGTEPGITPVYAAYPGFLTRLPDWRATVIIRIPNDPLNPGRQIWTYYTHLANTDGESFVAEEFPPGTFELPVEAGTFLGYMGNFSGDPGNPTGLHLHFSVVKDEDGEFRNELDIQNTYDPSPYFNLALNSRTNPDDIPLCDAEVTFEDWGLVESDAQ